MKFSIIIPVHNREDSIIRTIQSVAEQSFRDWELILVNDGSTDGTGHVCCEFARSDKRVVCINQSAKGVSVARNNGIKNAQGEYILFLDSDDGLRADALELLAQKILKYPDADLLVFGFEGAELLKNKTDIYAGEIDIAEKYMPAQLCVGACYEEYFIEHYVWNKCYRSTFIKNNNIFFDENHYTWEDGLFCIDCLSVAKGMAIIPESLCMQNIFAVEDHLSHRFFPNQIENYIKDAELYKTRFGHLYDFDAEYHCSHNIRILGDLFSKAIGKYERDSLKIISKVIETPLVQSWNVVFVPTTKHERLLKRFIAKRKAKNIYKLHRNSFFRKIYYRLRKLLK